MKIWDVKPPKWWYKTLRYKRNREVVNKFFNNLETRGGVVGDRAILFVYNEQAPELSYIITERL